MLQPGGLRAPLASAASARGIVHPIEGAFDLSGYDDLVEAVVGIITRHPIRQEELEKTLTKWSPGRLGQALAELEASGRAQVVERYGARFWSAAPSHYPRFPSPSLKIP